MRFLLPAILLCMPALADEAPAAVSEARFLTSLRQLTFEGRRAGEGYFSADGRLMVFQSEREPGNPFYQIYLLDLESGSVRRVSPGIGKTTCAWLHPAGNRVLYASTHPDPEAEAKQRAEIEFRAAGQERRYSWDYDEHYDLYDQDLNGGEARNLTNAPGYDAEGSCSPDGQWIVFASNRHAYTEPLSPEDAAAFERDRSLFMDLYLMRADGSDLRRLTEARGYDGGPFFSPDGKRIVWRRFTEDGATAEIHTMNTDGSDMRAVTRLGVMSWAPFYHPSGDYLIFTNNANGFGNFELYIVDVNGQRDPLRVTFTDGFDGLPVFSPDGRRLAWTSNRTADKSSQIFIADWNDTEARARLGLPAASSAPAVDGPDFAQTAAAIRAEDLRLHVEYLASPELEGRGTGTAGEQLAVEYAARAFRAFGLRLENGDGLQPFPFTAGVSLGTANRLALEAHGEAQEYTVDQDWRPLAYSRTGEAGPAGIVFAGYGISAPGDGEHAAYDSYAGIDARGKWVLAFRFLPENISPERRQQLNRHAGLRYKAMIARDRGAVGILFVNGPNSNAKDPLVRLAFDASLGATSIAAISIADAVAKEWLQFLGKDLKTLQDALDGGDAVPGFDLPLQISAHIDVQQEQRTGRNVIARLCAGDAPGGSAVVIGAHIDHLGRGATDTSLMTADDTSDIHYGADDNASGVAAVLEAAQYLADLKARGELALKHDILFAAWSGEELGLLGSSYFVDHYADKPASEPLQPEIIAYLNLDMVGRLDKELVLHGLGSSPVWAGEIERRNVPVGLSIRPQNDSYLPTDATPFYLRGVPILSAFTGVHADYHTPRDTPDKLNYEGAAKIARFMALVLRALAENEAAPAHIAMTKPESAGARASLRAYLGTVPDYADSGVKGVKLAGVTAGAPADAAGLRKGDVIVEVAGRAIENIYDYTYAIEALKIGEDVQVTVERNGARLSVTITPASRD